MRNLLAFLAKYNYWFLFALLEAVSLVLLFQYNGYQGSVWFSSANYVAGKLYEWDSAVESFFSLSKVNQELTQRNVWLEHQVHLLADSLQHVTGDTTLLRENKYDMLRTFRLVPAKVVSNTVDRRDNFITIDRGSADGVRRDMGVVCGNGVVGIVYLVSTHYSVVIPVLSSQSNISCAIERRGYFGYLHWTGGRPDIAFVDDVPRHAKFYLHDKVVTSGFSSVFPPGVAVGEILHVYNSPDGLSYRLMVRLTTDFGNLRDVCVIDDSRMTERLEVLQAAQDSIKPQEESNFKR